MRFLSVFVALILTFGVSAFAQQAQQPDVSRDVIQTFLEAKKDKIDLDSSEYMKLAMPFATLHSALTRLEANKMETTSDLYLAIQSLENIYAQSIVLVGERINEVEEQMNPTEEGAVTNIKVVQDKINECKADPNCTAQIDGKLYKYEELLRLLQNASATTSQVNLLSVQEIQAYNMSADTVGRQVSAKLSRFVAFKLKRIKDQIEKSAIMSQDEKTFFLESLKNVALKQKLSDLKLRAKEKAEVGAKLRETALQLQPLITELLPQLKAEADIKCGVVAWGCKNVRRMKKRQYDEYLKVLELIQGGQK